MEAGQSRLPSRRHHLRSIGVAPEQVQKPRLRRHRCGIGVEVAEGGLPQRGDAREGEGGVDPGSGGRTRARQAEGVVQAGPPAVISCLQVGWRTVGVLWLNVRAGKDSLSDRVDASALQ